MTEAQRAEAAPSAVSISSGEGSKERAKIVGRAGVVGAGTLLSRILGFGRDAVIAALFTRRETDAFWVALTIPNALRQLLAEGAVSSAVVPVLSERLAKGGDDAARPFFARARAVSLVALLVVTALGIFFARELTWLFASGYADDRGGVHDGGAGIVSKFELTTSLTRVMFPYILFMGTAALGMAALNAKRRFAVAAFAPALFSVGIVGAALTLRGPLAERGVDPSMTLAIGVLAGGVMQVVAQVPALRSIGYASRPIFDLRDPHVREMLRRIGPMAFGLGVYYVDLVLSRRFLSELGEGAQSWFSWASRLCDLPQGIFVMAIASATLPSLATFAAKGETDELVTTWAHGMRLAMFVAIPCSVALVVLGEPLVVLLFERGHFDPESSHQTARALAWQGGAIFTVAATRQLVPAFHALGDTRTPVMVSAIDLVAFIVLAFVLRGPLGHVGISIAVAGSSAVQMLLLFYGLRKRVGSLRGGELTASAARVLGASAIAAVASGALAHVLTGAVSGSIGRSLPGIASALVFAFIFLLAAWGLGARELAEVGAPIRRRLRRFR
jgi:putative peptidoglycan lipid II flippase